MNFAVHRLNEHKRAQLVAHFLALSAKDRCLRFCTSLAPTVIASYVDRIDFASDEVLGVHDDRQVLVGAAHVAFEDDRAELALSVLSGHRRRGIAGALFRHALAHVRQRRMPKLYMHCLSGNAPIMHIAHKYGMDIVAGAGAADAYLELHSTISGEVETRETKLAVR